MLASLITWSIRSYIRSVHARIINYLVNQIIHSVSTCTHRQLLGKSNHTFARSVKSIGQSFTRQIVKYNNPSIHQSHLFAQLLGYPITYLLGHSFSPSIWKASINQSDNTFTQPMINQTVNEYINQAIHLCAFACSVSLRLNQSYTTT